jgi:hypothetical protein
MTVTFFGCSGIDVGDGTVIRVSIGIFSRHLLVVAAATLAHRLLPLHLVPLMLSSMHAAQGTTEGQGPDPEGTSMLYVPNKFAHRRPAALTLS